MDSLLQNRKILVGLAGVLVLTGIGTALYSNRQEQKEVDSKNALYLAQKELVNESRALGPQNPKTPAEAGAVEFKRVAVTEKLPKTVAGLQAVISKFPGTRAAHEAEVLLGSLFLKHGEAPAAQGWFEKAAGSARGAFEKSVAYLNLGSVLEGQGKFKEAMENYERGASQGETAAQGELLLGVARAAAALKDAQRVKNSVEKIRSTFKDGEYVRSAEALAANL